jgi:hypothetical protein
MAGRRSITGNGYATTFAITVSPSICPEKPRSGTWDNPLSGHEIEVLELRIPGFEGAGA